MNSLIKIFIIGTFMLIGIEFIRCGSPCSISVHSKAYPSLYWYAANQSSVVLSRTSRTVWDVEVPPAGSLMGSLSIRVKSGSSSTLIDHYLCVDTSSHVSLCRPGVADLFQLWSAKNMFGYIIRTVRPGIFADILYIREPIKWSGSEVDFELTDDVTKSSAKWLVDIHEGCPSIFEGNARKITPLLTSTTSIPTTKQTTHVTTADIPPVVADIPNPLPSTTSIPTTKQPTHVTTSDIQPEMKFIDEMTSERLICIDENMKLIPAKPGEKCISVGSSEDIKNLLENAYRRMNHTGGSAKQVGNLKVMQFAERVEKIVLKVAELLDINESMDIKSNNFELRVGNQPMPFMFPDQNSPDRILVESSVETSGTYPMVGILYQNLHLNMIDEITLLEGIERFRVNSKLITASVDENIQIKRAVVVMSPLAKLDKSTTKTVCAFWNTKGDHHFWSTSGCQMLDSGENASKVICECNHLTNFALLTAPINFEIPEVHRKVLDMISFVCCIISIVSLFVGIVIFTILICREKKHTRYTIHLNLMVALFIAQLLFLTGIEATDNKIACKCVAYLLHYFLLVSFMWMLLEGVYLYILMVKVYSNGRTYISAYMAFAWITPGIILLITGLSTHKSYGTSAYCWLSNEDFGIWAFLGPVLAIIFVNMVILFMIIHQIIVISKRGSVANDVKIGLRTSLILLPILGVTWVFGMLSVNVETLVFQYIFAVTNALQGFMITLFHCFLNGEVRKSLRRVLRVSLQFTALGKYMDKRSSRMNRLNLTMTTGTSEGMLTSQKLSTKDAESTWDEDNYNTNIVRGEDEP